MNKKMVEAVAQRSGITVAVATALLEAGYTYLETFGKEPVWYRENRLVSNADNPVLPQVGIN